MLRLQVILRCALLLRVCVERQERPRQPAMPRRLCLPSRLPLCLSPVPVPLAVPLPVPILLPPAAISATYVHAVEYAMFTVAMNLPWALAGFPAWLHREYCGSSSSSDSGSDSGSDRQAMEIRLHCVSVLRQQQQQRQ